MSSRKRTRFQEHRDETAASHRQALSDDVSRVIPVEENASDDDDVALLLGDSDQAGWLLPSEHMIDPYVESEASPIPISMWKTLKPHQREGLRFLWMRTTQPDERRNGGVLAHSMGLGKTIQVVSFTMMYLRKYPSAKVLIVVPKSVTLNWGSEFLNWGDRMKLALNPTVIVDLQTISERLAKIESVFGGRRGGVLIMSRDQFRILVDPNLTLNMGDVEARVNVEKVKRKLSSLLVDPGPDVLIVDEGHELKNAKTRAFIALDSIATRRRIILTGTPLQNNLNEYRTMIRFVQPEYWTEKEFTNNFVIPIQTGMAKSATKAAIALMKCQSYVLKKELAPIVHRRDQSILDTSLPGKKEYLVYLAMSPLQQALAHAWYTSKEESFNTLAYCTLLNKLGEYPTTLRIVKKPSARQYEPEESSLQEMEPEVGVDDGRIVAAAQARADSAIEKHNVDPTTGFPRWSLPVLREFLADGRTDVPDQQLFDPKGPYYSKFFDLAHVTQVSTKAAFVQMLHAQCRSTGAKLLIFSQRVQTLNALSAMFVASGLSMPKDFLMLTGQDASIRRRQELIDLFNQDPNVDLFLISTEAGGVGINLTAASRVVVYDCSWNPTNDTQAIFRAYRFGQQNVVHIYRLVSSGLPEEVIMERVLLKKWMHLTIVEDKTPVREVVGDSKLVSSPGDMDPPRDESGVSSAVAATDDVILARLWKQAVDNSSVPNYDDEPMLARDKEKTEGLRVGLLRKVLNWDSLLKEDSNEKMSARETQDAEAEYSKTVKRKERRQGVDRRGVPMNFNQCVRAANSAFVHCEQRQSELFQAARKDLEPLLLQFKALRPSSAENDEEGDSDLTWADKVLRSLFAEADQKIMTLSSAAADAMAILRSCNRKRESWINDASALSAACPAPSVVTAPPTVVVQNRSPPRRRASPPRNNTRASTMPTTNTASAYRTAENVVSFQQQQPGPRTQQPFDPTGLKRPLPSVPSSNHPLPSHGFSNVGMAASRPDMASLRAPFPFVDSSSRGTEFTRPAPFGRFTLTSPQHQQIQTMQPIRPIFRQMSAMQTAPQSSRPGMQTAPQSSRPGMQTAPQSSRPGMQTAPQSSRPGMQTAPQSSRPGMQTAPQSSTMQQQRHLVTLPRSGGGASSAPRMPPYTGQPH